MTQSLSPREITLHQLNQKYGSSFRFLKLVKKETYQYAVSKLYDMFNPGNDLYEVLRVLKRLSQ